MPRPLDWEPRGHRPPDEEGLRRGSGGGAGVFPAAPPRCWGNEVSVQGHAALGLLRFDSRVVAKREAWGRSLVMKVQRGWLLAGKSGNRRRAARY
ncbi:hypothetical protein NDU88_005278 [Pleurodeles waltl]|uniref:Uncharacterized protein n=1 Tax=Pleurodeles waltl TaxID=8319 RepID=A0AAV7WXU0_PLEWA|nr:hypothetical protein NDU88_005278 [Pleurodeles waltl]